MLFFIANVKSVVFLNAFTLEAHAGFLKQIDIAQGFQFLSNVSDLMTMNIGVFVSFDEIVWNTSNEFLFCIYNLLS